MELVIHDMNSIIKLLATSLLFIAVLLTDTLIGATILFIIFVLLKLGQIPLATVGRLALYPAFSYYFINQDSKIILQEGLLIVVRSALAALLVNAFLYYTLQ